MLVIRGAGVGARETDGCLHCAVLEQQLHDVGVAVGGCLLDRLIVMGVNVCAVVNEKLRDICMAARTRLTQGRIMTSVQVNAVLQEDLDNGQTATTTRHQQHVHLVRVRACVQKHAHNLGMAVLRG